MTTLSPIIPSPPGGTQARSGRDRSTRAGQAQPVAALLLGDALGGHGSLAPTDSSRPKLLLGDAGGGRGSLAPTERRRTRTARRPTRAPLLEEALAAHVASLGHNRLQHDRLRAVINRLGLGGRPPLTLAEAGRIAGLSGERVRQLEGRLRKQQRESGASPVLPQLDAALSAVARAVPLPASGVPRLLIEAGLTAGSFSTESLRCAAELLGRDVPFVLSGVGPTAVLLPRMAAAAVAHAPAIEARARRQAERCGASTLEELERELGTDDGVTVPRRHLRVVLETSGSVLCLQQGWFCFIDARATGPFARASSRMLAVTPSLSVESLRDGLRRLNAFRRLPAPPPASVLAQVYRQHPWYAMEDGLVSAIQPIELDEVGPLNRRMVEILRAAPGGVLPRSQLLDACHEAGLNLTSVNLYSTYSECIERVGPGLFAARGSAVAPRDQLPVRRRPAYRADDGPVHGVSPDGRPWLAGRVTPSTWANGVMHVPAELRRSLQGRHFPCHDDAGRLVTTLGIDLHGNSWGWTGFLRRVDARLGDIVRAVFDPATGTAVLELVAADDSPPAA